MFSDHNGIKPEANKRMLSGKSLNIEMKQYTLKYPFEITKEIRKYFELYEIF